MILIKPKDTEAGQCDFTIKYSACADCDGIVAHKDGCKKASLPLASNLRAGKVETEGAEEPPFFLYLAV